VTRSATWERFPEKPSIVLGFLAQWSNGVHVFISYARADKAFVRRLHDEIVVRGRDVWVDWEDLRAFDRSWRATLFAAIEACGTFAFIMTPASVASGVCAQEVAHAAQHGKRLAVIVRQPVPETTWKERVPWLETPQWFFFETDDQFRRSVDGLLEALDTDQDHVEAHTRLYVRAREWEARVDDSSLLRGSELRDAESWLEAGGDRQPQPTPLHKRFIRDSRQAAIREIASQLASAAEFAANQLDPTLSILLAIEAYRLAPARRLERVLRRGLLLPRLVWSAPAAEGATGASTSPDGQYAAIPRDQKVRVVEIPSGREIAALEHNAPASALLFSPTGRYLMTWESISVDDIWESGWVRVWEIRTGRLAAEEFSDGRIFSVQYDSAERYAVAGNWMETAIVIDLDRGSAVRLKHRDAVVSALAFDPRTRYLAAGQAGATRTRSGQAWQVPESNDLWVWGVPGWRRVALVKGTGEVNRLAFSPAGDLLVAACSRGRSCSLRVWKATQSFGWTRFRELGRLEHWKAVNEIVFHPEFWWTFATACDDGVVRIIDAARQGNQHVVGEAYRLTHDGAVTSVAFIPCDEKGERKKNIIAGGGKDRTVREWHGTKELTRAVHPIAVEQVRYSADRNLLITATAQGGVYAWASNHDQPSADDMAAESLIEELGRRLRRNLTLDEWRSYFGDEPYRRTFEHLKGPEG
jgi:WD40 repeat protein